MWRGTVRTRCGVSRSRCRSPHPERHQGGGRRRTEDRALAAILYVLESGCRWRQLPGSLPVHWRTANRRFAEWVAAGVMTALHQAVLGVAGQLDWSRASIDSMPVRALKGGT